MLTIDELRRRWDGGWRIDGRPIRNMEMSLLIQVKEVERQQQEAHDATGNHQGENIETEEGTAVRDPRDRQVDVGG